MTNKIVNSDLLIAEIIKGIEDVKGENISIIDLREIENTVCDYFILCDGNSNTQVSAIAASIQKTAEIIKRPADIEIRDVGMPVFMRPQRLLKPRPFL